MKLPLISGEGLCKLVSKLGFELRHRKGSHTFWKHSDGRTTVIPLHKKLKRSLIRKILKDIDISTDEYIKYKK